MSVIRNNRLNIWTTHNAHSRALLRSAHSRAFSVSGVSRFGINAMQCCSQAHSFLPKIFASKIFHCPFYPIIVGSIQKQNSHCVSE